MPTTKTDGQELTAQHIEILRKLPGFHLNSGTPCLCGIDSISTTKQIGYSDFCTFTHRCRECGNKFTTYIEG